MKRHHTDAVTERHEVVVVGARDAGASTAMLLAAAGIDVLVLDRAELPGDTVSTHGIARGGIVQLARWGLLERVVDSGAPPIRTVSLHVPSGVQHRPVSDHAGVDLLLAPRRFALDEILLDAARDAGASVRTGVSAVGTTTDVAGRVNGVVVRERDGSQHAIRARVVVGADGVRSRIARAVRARTLEARPPGGATHYLYVAGLDADGLEVHTTDRMIAGVFPTHGGEANVWVCSATGPRPGDSADRAASFLELLDQRFPALADRVRTAEVTSPVRGASGLPNHVLQAGGPGWALVGDAGYHRDPITGHGITDAFRDAELLASALVDVLRHDEDESVALDAYGSARQRALSPIFDVTCRMSQLPMLDELVDLQKQLSALLDLEAERLAAQPPPPTAALVAAASIA